MGGAFTLDALDILYILKAVGLCANLESPKQKSDLTFDQVLLAFLKEISQKGKTPTETLPLPAIVGEGCQVDLLRLFCVVREKGGHLSVTTSWSWADVAESISLEPQLGPSVKLVYVKYLSTLETWIQRVSDKKVDPTLNKGLFPLLKRKRDSTVGMLNWVRDLAKRPRHPFDNTTSVSNEVHTGNKRNLAVDYFKLAVLIRKEIFLKTIRKDSSLISTTTKKVMYTSSPNLKKKGVSPVTPDTNLTKSKNNPAISPLFSWLSLDEQSQIPVGPNHQAVIPVCSNNKSHPNADPDALKYLGTCIGPPDNPDKTYHLSSQKGKIGRKNCECLIPGSTDCVRFHIAENRLNIKRELGPAFYKMGFHKMGEEISLSWKEEEEEKFKFVIRENSPNEGFNFWDPLKKNFKCKGWRGLVSYYLNVFLVRRRTYQNRLVHNKIDSDDDEIEPCFLDGTHFCVQNSQCIDLDP